jgi:uncharacterized protein YqhQ
MPEAPTPGSPTRPYIGGQAVLEGVMMRSPTSFAVVVRRRDGSLHVRERLVPDGRKGVAKLPLVRGVASLVESLRLGSEALRFSAEQMERDLEAEEEAASKSKSKAPTKKSGGGIGTSLLGVLRAIGYTLFLVTTADADASESKNESAKAKPVAKAAADEGVVESGSAPKEEAEKKGGRGPMSFMLVIMILFLIALPQIAAAGLNSALKLNLDVQSPAFQALTGSFKLSIVVGYLLLVRRVFPDIRRVFQYHGAEHKTISTYEANEPLTVENARAKTTLHPRCGTTFLVMVALVSIIVFTAVGGFLPKIHTGKAWLDNVVFFAEKLPFLPLIAAVTFEIQRVFARWCTVGPLRVLLWPGFLCQKITTIEPDDDQLEIALASLRVTLFREEAVKAEAAKAEAGALADAKPAAPAEVRYKSFDALMKAPRLRRAA